MVQACQIRRGRDSAAQHHQLVWLGNQKKKIFISRARESSLEKFQCGFQQQDLAISGIKSVLNEIKAGCRNRQKSRIISLPAEGHGISLLTTLTLSVHPSITHWLPCPRAAFQAQSKYACDCPQPLALQPSAKLLLRDCRNLFIGTKSTRE